MKSRETGLGSEAFIWGLVVFCLVAGCGYRFVGVEGLPAGMPCVSVHVVRNDTWEPGIDLVFRRDLETAFARRGLECGSGRDGGQVGVILSALELRPTLLTTAGDAASFAAYRVSIGLEAWVERDGERVWTSGPLSVEGEFPIAEAEPGESGLARHNAIARLWSRLSPEVASRVVTLVGSDM